MSFLSRKPARPDGRGRGDEYDDFDDYADDGYAQSDDDGWSPNQYFSPEGIKGKWAGETPGGRSGGRGQRDAGQESYGTDFTGAPGGPGYGADEFETGMYDLPDGTDDDRGERRGSRRSRDREDRGERTGILRLRRDRGEDIWPEEVVSDEDYWASVAADRPFHSDAPLGDGPGPGARPRPGPRPGPDARPGAGRPGTSSRPGPDGRPGAVAGGADSRFAGEQRGGPGRLGPAPGLAADYKPAPAAASGAVNGSGGFGGPGQPGGTGRTSSGAMPARPGTGPHPVRPGTGPTPTVGVTSSRPPAKPSAARPGPGSPVSASGGFPKQQAPVRPSFQPTSTRSGGLPSAGPGGGPGSGRQQEWGDRTERIERVNVSGYPEPRPAARSQGPGPASGRRGSGPLGLGAGTSGTPVMPGSVSGSSGGPGAPGRGRGDSAAWRAPDRREPDRQQSDRQALDRQQADRLQADRRQSDRQAPDRQAPDRRAPGRDSGREVSGPWPVAASARGAAPARGASDDDPLTSKAYSRAAMSETDGRSYRVAARRSSAQVKLTEQAETFLSAPYQAGTSQQGRGGDYWQYRDDTPAPVPQSPAAQSGSGRYPALGGQPAQPGQSQTGRSQSGRSQGGPGQPASGHPGPAQAGPGPGPGRASQPGFTPGNPGRPALPGAGTGPGPGLPSGQYEAQQQRPAQQQQQRPQQRPGQPQLPAAGLSAAPSSSSAAGGQNPYDSAVTGAYPYSGQAYSAGRQAPGGPAQEGPGDPYYRPSAAGYPADAYQAGGASQGRAEYDQGNAGYGSGYPAPGDRRY